LKIAAKLLQMETCALFDGTIADLQGLTV